MLVVDDDPGVREVLRQALGDEGYEVMVARNGYEALARAEARRPDLILVDLMMPVMDGWQLVRECEARDSLGSVPVIVLSAGRNVRRSLGELRVQAVVEKPFDLDELLDLVADHAS